MNTPFIDGYKDADLLIKQGFSHQMIQALLILSMSNTVGEGKEDYFNGSTYRLADLKGKIKVPQGEKGEVIRGLFLKNKGM